MRILLYALIWLGCTSQPSNSPKVVEVWTLYSKIDSINYKVKRLADTDGSLKLSEYQIKLVQPEIIEQTITSHKTITKEEAEKARSYSNDFNWRPPFKEKSVLFLQVQYPEFQNEAEALKIIEPLYANLDHVIQGKNQGEAFASDIGPAGVNILFEVREINSAIQTLTTKLKEFDFKPDNVVIARRVLQDTLGWFYEIIYPLNYSGKFITL